MECPEQAALSYIDGYTPKKINKPMEFGSIFHYCLEHQFSYKTPEECVYSICQQYEAWRSKTLLHTKERDDLKELIGLVEVTFPAYCRYWAEDDARITWIEREAKFRVPYVVETPEGPRNISLRGMRDGIYRVPKVNTLAIFETKTKSRISEFDIRNGLKADMQTLFYSFVTYLEKKERPEQVTYNVVRRSSEYRNVGMSSADYVKKVETDIKKRPDFYFTRYRVDMMQSDLDQFVVRTLNPLLCRFIKWWDSIKKNPTVGERWAEGNRSPYHYQNLNALNGKYGKVAEYEKIVNNTSRSYRIRSEAFPELSNLFQVTP